VRPLEVGLVVYRAMPCAEGIVAQVIVFDRASASAANEYPFASVPVDPVLACLEVTASGDRNSSLAISKDVAIHERCAPEIVKVNAALLILADSIASEGQVAARLDGHSVRGVAEDVIVFQYPLPPVADMNAGSAAVINTVAPQNGIAAFSDRHACEGTRKDLVILDCPLAVLVDVDAACLSMMDPVAPETGIGTAADGNTISARAADIAMLQIQSALYDFDAKPVAFSQLAHGQARNAPHGGDEEDGIASRGFDPDLLSVAVANDLQRFVDDQSFDVSSRSNDNPVTSLGGLDSIGDCAIVTSPLRVHHPLGRRSDRRGAWRIG
jgi:hypothetical protein